jgi:hypothetical protein
MRAQAPHNRLAPRETPRGDGVGDSDPPKRIRVAACPAWLERSGRASGALSNLTEMFYTIRRIVIVLVWGLVLGAGVWIYQRRGASPVEDWIEV